MIETLEYFPHAELQGLSSGKQPIPELRPIAGWQTVPIAECGEPLVALHKYQGRNMTVRPQYFTQGYRSASFEQEIRSGVFERLLLAAHALPADYRLVIWDAWRPVELQQEIYNRFYQQLSQQFTPLSTEELAVLCQQFVALPSADQAKPAHHHTGGAVDVTIMDDFGQELWMGSGFDEFTEKSHTRYFEQEENCRTERDKEAQRNRRILFDAMTSVGMFTGLDTEWWHFQYGTQAHGLLTNQSAWYGVPSAKKERSAA